MGALSREEQLDVERFLESHPAAAETLRGLAPTADTFLIALQGAPGARAAAPEVRGIVESAKRVAAETGLTCLGETARVPIESNAETNSTFSGAPTDVLSFLAPAEGPDELGRLGGYRILRVLGMGGMGVVFEAEDPRLVRRVALKVVRPTIAREQGIHDRFLREARAAAAIEHENVVTIHQVGEDRGVPFLAMPLLQGESLDNRLKRDKRLPAAEVIRIGREIAEGLAAAHEHGLIHRDIKPGNVWLDRRSGRVKILDFGLARGTGQTDEPQLTLAGSIIGTPAYMAPEQAQGQTLDGRCDLFSLGCILFRSLTGVLPFPGSTPMQISVVSSDTHAAARRCGRSRCAGRAGGSNFAAPREIPGRSPGDGPGSGCRA
jgi:serine/threonine protein kinase